MEQSYILPDHDKLIIFIRVSNNLIHLKASSFYVISKTIWNNDVTSAILLLTELFTMYADKMLPH